MNEQSPVSYLNKHVGWGDCDAAGIAYYAQYYDWFCDGRHKLLKDYGMKYSEWFHDRHISLVVLESHCCYKKLLFPEEPITIATTLEDITLTRAVFEYCIYKTDDRLAATGFTEHAYVNEQGKACNIKKKQPELWEKLTELFNNQSRLMRE